jgi:TRAP-type C4-dicarboxylate transport system substrate-binding protein
VSSREIRATRSPVTHRARGDPPAFSHRAGLAFPASITDTGADPISRDTGMGHDGQHMGKGRATTARLAAGARAFGLAAGLALAAAAGFSSGAAAQDKVMTIKLATATLNDAQHEWLKRFAVAIEKNTNGRIKAEVYPASQLGAIPRMIEGTQLGSIQAWIGPPEFLVGVDPRFEILSVPGLIKDDQHSIRILNDPEFAKTFLAIGANKGLVGTSLFWTGPMGFDMREPVRKLADLKGKKLRVLASPFQMEQLSRIGGTGVPLTLGDVLPALQQGAIDGALGSLPVFSALQYEASAKYMTETSHSYIFSVAMFSKRWFDALPDDLKAAVLKTSDEVKAQVVPWSLNFLAEQRKQWAAKGGEVINFSDADHAELMAKMRPIGDDIVKSKPDLKPIWEALLATAKRTEK